MHKSVIEYFDAVEHLNNAISYLGRQLTPSIFRTEVLQAINIIDKLQGRM